MENVTSETVNAIAAIVVVVIGTLSVALLVERLVDGVASIMRGY